MPRRPKDFQAHPFAYHEVVSVPIRSLSIEGFGIGRIDDWLIRVPDALPGELVRARVWRNCADHSDADLVEILQPSAERVEPRCPLAGRCGGCQVQHMQYRAQLAWKARQVGELLDRIGGIRVAVKRTHPSPREYGYRSKITPHYQRPRDHRDFPIGFQSARSRRLIDVPACPIATEAINQRLPVLREQIRATRESIKRGGTLLLREAREGVVADPNAEVSERVGRYSFQFRAGEFFQNNPFILPAFVDHVVRASGAVQITELIDIYCGVGVFSISASSHFQRVTGIEVSASSVRWARANATVNGIDNCRFLVGEAESLLPQVSCNPAETAVIVDPPRKGCHPDLIGQLAQIRPSRLVYVSCAPATQARDLKLLVRAGYEVIEVQPFDLFPQTRHIESVATLVMKSHGLPDLVETASETG